MSASTPSQNTENAINHPQCHPLFGRDPSTESPPTAAASSSNSVVTRASLARYGSAGTSKGPLVATAATRLGSLALSRMGKPR